MGSTNSLETNLLVGNGLNHSNGYHVEEGFVEEEWHHERHFITVKEHVQMANDSKRPHTGNSVCHSSIKTIPNTVIDTIE